jgi:hypothetical protein
MSVQGFIVGLCVLVALAYVLRPSLLRWLQRGRAGEASGNTGGSQPPGACGACSACSGCPSGKPRD